MNLNEIVSHANTISDEDIGVQQGVGFVNDAIAKINIQCKANFPFFDINEASTNYTAFTDTWQRALLIPFVVGRIKQTDSSQFEYSDSYSEFMANLEKFEQDFTIPDEYKNASARSRWASEDYTQSPWGW